MAGLDFVRMLGLTREALVHPFPLVRLVGSRRPRAAFEWLLFATSLSLSLFHTGSLLGVDATIHSPEPPKITWRRPIALMAAGRGVLPGALARLHVANAAGSRGGAGRGEAKED